MILNTRRYVLSQLVWLRNSGAAFRPEWLCPRFPAGGSTRDPGRGADACLSTHFPGSSLTWLLVGGLSSWPSGPLHKALGFLTVWQRVSKEEAPSALSDRTSRVGHLQLVVFGALEAGHRGQPRLVGGGGAGIRLHLLKREVSKNLRRYSETTSSTRSSLRLYSLSLKLAR